MRTDQLYLNDIIAAADSISRFITGIDNAGMLQSDEMRQSAVLQKLIVIGEAASQVSSELRSDYPDIPWRQIIAFRNSPYTPTSELIGALSGRRLWPMCQR